MNDVNLYSIYRNNKRSNCRAEFKIKPEKDDLTYKQKINGKTRYFLSDEVKLDDQKFKICVINVI
jgi:hypothetical protein